MSASAPGDPPRRPPRTPEPTARPTPGGLCPACRHVRTLRSDRGSTFLLCELSRRDPRFPRYPPQPCLVCPGFER